MNTHQNYGPTGKTPNSSGQAANRIQPTPPVQDDRQTEMIDGGMARARLSDFIKDWFVDPEQILQMRRHMRTWFLENSMDWESGFGQSIKIQAYHYEILDELLSELIIHASKTAKP